MASRQQWYNAVLLLEAVLPDKAELTELLTERRVIVLRASTDDEARSKANEFGSAAAHEYRNVDGERVQWRYRSVLEVTPLYVQEITDGTEVFAELFPAGEEPETLGQ
jgi:hypothetical protein